MRPPAVQLRLRLPAWAVLAVVFLATLAGCHTPPPVDVSRRPFERGIASWYGPGFHGNRTASGERFDTHDLTAAHKTLPFGTLVEVRNLDNGRRVQVRINDRGPFVRRRVIDLSRAAAEALEMIGPGLAEVELYLVGERPEPEPRSFFTVQVGAFGEAWRATSLAGHLRDRYPEVVVRSEGPWHRVHVGRFERKAGAHALRRELHRDGYQAVVVRAADG